MEVDKWELTILPLRDKVPCMELLLVRFEKPQRAFIRREARRIKKSEAEVVRESVSLTMRYRASKQLSKK